MERKTKTCVPFPGGSILTNTRLRLSTVFGALRWAVSRALGQGFALEGALWGVHWR